ncbi:hypothetical protein F485_gp253 [Aeromonas phage CC2]|uniref:Uncharacterized protein n=1 Tax=Aeromonas phage CC2 TaxID=1204516 RepID=I6XHA9_9CAUD|nr:hypothetical protein F485_gp253 [Aeromonas phage CC2]AFN39466.1 hypothetical protein CC2_042 [Aeromonas phage CC2]
MVNEMMNAIAVKLEEAKSKKRQGLVYRNAYAVLENGPDSFDYVVSVHIEATVEYDGKARDEAIRQVQIMTDANAYLGYGYTAVRVEV